MLVGGIFCNLPKLWTRYVYLNGFGNDSGAAKIVTVGSVPENMLNFGYWRLDPTLKMREEYAHTTNRFCVVQENIKPDVLKVRTELARSMHLDRGLYIFLYKDKTG